MTNALDPARLAALHALLDLWENGGVLNEAEFAPLQGGDRARAFRLAREVLRNETGFDRIIKERSERKPSEPVRAILHLGAHELLIDNTAPHGVIHAWVEIAKSEMSTKASAGFINAILRKIADERPRLIPTNQFGKALRAHLLMQYSASTLDQINKLQSHYPPTDIWIPKGDMADWAQRLGGEVIADTRTVRLQGHPKLSELDGYATGEWWVQDAAASIAALQFGDIIGKRVLDLCAAPGGKLMQLASLGANVTAVEVSENRAKRIAENLERTGLQAEVMIEDALVFEGKDFDFVLLDAPCSATGTIRRHPDLRFDEPLARAKALATLQAQLIERGFAALKEGGALIYVTCSLLHEEGEAQIERFLQNNPNAKRVPLTNPFTQETRNDLRILPTDLAEIDGCDGFFIAKIYNAKE